MIFPLNVPMEMQNPVLITPAENLLLKVKKTSEFLNVFKKNFSKCSSGHEISFEEASFCVKMYLLS